MFFLDKIFIKKSHFEVNSAKVTTQITLQNVKPISILFKDVLKSILISLM